MFCHDNQMRAFYILHVKYRQFKINTDINKELTLCNNYF